MDGLRSHVDERNFLFGWRHRAIGSGGVAESGIFCAQGVKSNVLFFDRKPASETPWTKQLWIYDLRDQPALHAQDEPLEAG
jgi:hypothetical protein